MDFFSFLNPSPVFDFAIITVFGCGHVTWLIQPLFSNRHKNTTKFVESCESVSESLETLHTLNLSTTDNYSCYELV